MSAATAHQPITLFVGTENCFERECEEYIDEDGADDPGVERCSHIREERVCESCSTKRSDGDYEPVVAWAGEHATLAEAVRNALPVVLPDPSCK